MKKWSSFFSNLGFALFNYISSFPAVRDEWPQCNGFGPAPARHGFGVPFLLYSSTPSLVFAGKDLAVRRLPLTRTNAIPNQVWKLWWTIQNILGIIRGKQRGPYSPKNYWKSLDIKGKKLEKKQLMTGARRRTLRTVPVPSAGRKPEYPHWYPLWLNFRNWALLGRSLFREAIDFRREPLHQTFLNQYQNCTNLNIDCKYIELLVLFPSGQVILHIHSLIIIISNRNLLPLPMCGSG